MPLRRAGSTRVSFNTNTSPGKSRAGKSRTIWSPKPLSETWRRRAESRGDAGRAAIRSGGMTNRRGDAVSEPRDEGLIREDDKVLYPVREDIPIMLIDEAIELDTLA